MIAITIIIIMTLMLLHFVYTPLPLLHQHTVSISKGMTVRSVLNLLQAQQVLDAGQAKQFFLWVKINRAEKKIKAGTYVLSGPLTADQLLNKLIRGDVVQQSLTIIEGQRVQEFLEKLKQHPMVEQTIGALSEEEILALLQAPYPYLEGIFFPDTYYFSDRTKDTVLLQLAYDTMQQHLAKAWDKRADNLVLKTPYEALILASIIEKEGQLRTEQPMISGVFHRRLLKKMRLQSDPTVIYGLSDKNKTLTRSDLKIDHPFNTYVHRNLPPSPIALPGLSAIDAALHPDDSETLYFVARGDSSGSHVFSNTLEEHNQAVSQYRRNLAVQGEKNE